MKGKTIRLRFSGRTIFFIKKNGVALIFTLIMLAGFICGVVFSQRGGSLSLLCRMIYEIFLGTRLNGDFLRVFITSALSSALFVLGAYLSGLSLAGIPPLALLSFLKGAVLGIIGGCVVGAYSFKGFAFYVTVAVVPGVISSMALILSCRESGCFSAFLIRALSTGSKGSLMADFKIYCFRYLIILGVALSAAVADMLLSCFFAGLFGLV